MTLQEKCPLFKKKKGNLDALYYQMYLCTSLPDHDITNYYRMENLYLCVCYLLTDRDIADKLCTCKAFQKVQASVRHYPILTFSVTSPKEGGRKMCKDLRKQDKKISKKEKC